MSKIIFTEEGIKPPAPSSGQVSMYVKTDEVLYIQDAAGIEIPLGSSAAITQLTGDVTGIGPGPTATTVSLVGGSSATNVHAAELAANAATAVNTASTIVKRDASGNFVANTITASLNGNANTATTATNFTGALLGDITGTQSATVVALIGGSTATNVHSAELAANAATSSNTASTIIKRDASGNFSTNTITANLTGIASNATNAVTAINFTGALLGDITGTQSATIISNSTVTAKVLTGYSVGSNTPISATDSILIAFEKTQGQINAATSSSITALTGDISASGPGSAIATVNNVGGSSAINIHTAELLANAATSLNTASTIVERDASGNFAAGTITANLIGNALTSTNFTSSLIGDITGTQSATVVSTVGGSSATNVHLAELAANAATNSNTASTIVKRNASGNFTAGTITANLSGNISGSSASFTSSLSGDVTGTQLATVVSTVGGSSAISIHSAELAANAATTSNTASTIVLRDASGNFTAGTITANLSGNATTATTATNFSGSLSGDVIGTQSATAISATTITGKALTGYVIGANTSISSADTVLTAFEKVQGQINGVTGTGITALTGDVSATGPGNAAATVNNVGGKSAASIAQSVTDTQAATSLNTASTIIKRDASGNFAASIITANLTGNASGSAASFTGALAGDVIGAQSATIVATVGGSTAANIHSAELSANAATSLNTASTIVKRDASGNFVANTITANLTGNVIGNVSGSSSSFTGSLSGDVTGTQGATAILNSTVTGKVLTGFVNGSNTPILAADSILIAFEKTQAQINSTNSSAITALTGDVSATGPGSTITIVNSVGGSSAVNIHTAELATNAATSSNTSSAIVKRDGSGNFAAGIITANLNGNAINFTGPLIGDVTGTQGTTVVSLVGNSTAANVHTAELAANAATAANTASTIVKRDALGNFVANTITANLTGNVSGSATSFTGSLVGDITGTQGATVVSATTNNTLVTLSALTTASNLSSVGTITSGTWNATPIAVNKGGTGQTTYTDGQLLIGNSTGNTLTKTTLTPGAGISITNSSGSITIANTSLNAQVTKTGNYTITSTDSTIFIDSSSGTFTLTLPNPSTLAGKIYRIIDTTGFLNTNTVTLARFSTEKIEGLTSSKPLQTAWGWFDITTNGTDWFVG